MASQILSAPDLWAKIVDIVKDRVNNRSLWETMEQAVGIAIEDDNLIVGLNSRIINQAGHLNKPEHRNHMERAITEMIGARLNIRVIEGDTLDDWRGIQRREARVAETRSQSFERRDREASDSQSWDALHDFVNRAYSATHMRSLPQNKAHYLHRMILAIAESMDALYPANPDDATERHLARVIEKVAIAAEVPASMVAFEIDRVRASR